jgi:hypothetical protein
MSEDIKIAYRDPTIQDYNFILSSWLKSARHAFPDLSDQVYYEDYKSKVRNTLASKDTMLAVDPEDTSLILGYLVYSPNHTVHYVYIKHALRNFGIAKKLLQEVAVNNPITATTLTSTAKRYMSKHPGYIVYNPFKE